jgi:hypothetical protein
MTVVWMNQTIPVYGHEVSLQPNVYPYPRFETNPFQTANSVVYDLSDIGAPIALPSPRVWPFTNTESPPRISTVGTGAPFTLDPDAILRCSALGRPIGGVPPALARSVAANADKKERARSAQRKNVSSKNSSSHVASVLQMPTPQAIQDDVIGFSLGAMPRSPMDPASKLSHRSQKIPTMPTVTDRFHLREDLVHGHTKDPTEASPNNVISQHSLELFVNDLTPVTHDATIGVDMPSTASGDQITQVSYNGTFAYAFGPSRGDQDSDTARRDETQTSMGYFWPIGQRVKTAKRGSDVENSWASKKIRV